MDFGGWHGKNIPNIAKKTEKYVLDNLKPILQSEKLKKIGHNLKYDRNVLVNYNINLIGIEHDSMLLSYVYDSTAIRHGLDNAAEKYLSHKTIHYEDRDIQMWGESWFPPCIMVYCFRR